MDHNKIENELIIERFVSHELEQGERQAFFEHCLTCGDCRRKVAIAAWIDDELFDMQHYLAPKKQRTPLTGKKTGRNVKPGISYSAAAAMIIVAFAVGFLVKYQAGNMQNNPPAIVQEITDTTKNDTTKAKTPVKELDHEKNTTIPKKEPDKNSGTKMADNVPQKKTEEKVEENTAQNASTGYTEGNWNLLACAELPGIGDVSAKSKSKGAESDTEDVDAKKLNNKLTEFSKIPNPSIGITQPAPNQEFDKNKQISFIWKPEKAGTNYSVIIFNRTENKVIQSWDNISATSFTFSQTPDAGYYFLLVVDRQSHKWQSIKFSVK